jgi:hypothetical protein
MAGGSGSYILANGTDMGSYFQATATLQSYHEAGTWKVCGVAMSDAASNSLFYQYSSYFSLVNYVISGSDTGIPIGGPVTVTGTTPDTTAPTINSITMTPASTSAYPATVTIKVYYTETGSGFSSGSVSLVSPSYLATSTGAYLYATMTNMGTYMQGTVTLQGYHETGNWVLGSVSMTDVAGNTRNYYTGNSPLPQNYLVGGSNSGVPIPAPINKQ